MTCEEMVKAILEKRRKKEIEDYVEEVLEGMTEIELTGPSLEALEGRVTSVTTTDGDDGSTVFKC